ncbi:hypothetical protein [Thalassospira aquimaris]|uniref:DUF1328 domain-containing protein n=1 Tax=Thalassospira aquimaris TaxID=3037796 RepID=A0ABT6GHN4_9PROT|nr:hypothetical protein [Thalassospira sp. FZY0004]MDG4721595.1 hypothetical protein [Thalassospira sp. FZY0004]
MTKETWWLIIGFVAFFALTAIFGGDGIHHGNDVPARQGTERHI